MVTLPAKEQQEIGRDFKLFLAYYPSTYLQCIPYRLSILLCSYTCKLVWSLDRPKQCCIIDHACLLTITISSMPQTDNRKQYVLYIELWPSSLFLNFSSG